jgi:hypothetical protein
VRSPRTAWSLPGRCENGIGEPFCLFPVDAAPTEYLDEPSAPIVRHRPVNDPFAHVAQDVRDGAVDQAWRRIRRHRVWRQPHVELTFEFE